MLTSVGSYFLASKVLRLFWGVSSYVCLNFEEIPLQNPISHLRNCPMVWRYMISVNMYWECVEVVSMASLMG